MSYYPPQGSYAQPVVYTSSHRSHRPEYNTTAYPYPATQAYPGTQYYPSQQGANVVYVPASDRSRSPSRSRHHHRRHRSRSRTPVIVAPASARHHRHREHRAHSHTPLTFGDRVRRFFGLRPKAYRYQSSHSSWGFLGRSHRPRYTDARTGQEVDRKGRPVYRV